MSNRSSRHLIHGLVALTLLCGVFAGAGEALAQDDERARVHYEAGTSYFSEGDYETALREFNRSFALSERPVLLYNIALCHERLGDFPAAIDNLRRFLVEVPDAPNRDVVQRRLTHMEERLARQAEESQTGNPPDEAPPEELPPADVVGPDEQIPADALDHRIAGDTPPPPTETDTPDPSAGIPTSALASFIGGGVGLVTFAVFGGLAVGENSSLSDSCSPTCANTDTLDTYTIVADIGLGLAVIGGVLGVVFLLTADDGDSSDEASATLAPWVDPNGAGLVAQGSF